MKLEQLQVNQTTDQAALAHWMYLEQNVNDIYPIYKKWWAKMSGVDKSYAPYMGRSVVCRSIDVQHAKGQEADIAQLPPSSNTTEGNWRFLVHPENRTIPADNREIMAAPTSSTRTVLVGGDEPYFAKLSLPYVHFNYRRELSAENADYALKITNELAKLALVGASDPGWAFLPETRAVTHQGQGCIYREVNPFPRLKQPLQIIPAFALYSPDMKAPDDKNLLTQILGADSQHNPGDQLIEKIIGPVQSMWLYYAEHRGLLLDLHGQNCLFELDGNGQIGRLVMRDFDSIYVDSARRQTLELPTLRTDAFAAPEAQKQYAVSYDHMIGVSFFSRIIKAFCKSFPDYNEAEIATLVAQRFQKLQGPHIAATMPVEARRLPSSSGSWTGVDSVTIGKPLFR